MPLDQFQEEMREEYCYHRIITHYSAVPLAVVHPRGPAAGVCDHAADGANSSQETLVLGSRGVKQKLRVNEGSK